MMLLRYIKLTAGDELIGQVQDEEIGYDLRVLHNPWRMVLTSQGYVPCPIPIKSMEINSIHVLYEGEVDDDLGAAYKQQHGGIVRPPKGLVV